VRQHLFGFFGGFGDGFRQAYAAFFAGVSLFELAFAAPAGVDLCLDHP